MSEQPLPEPFVTIDDLADAMQIPDQSDERSRAELQEALDAAIEYVSWRVKRDPASLDGAARDFRVYPSGRNLVLSATHLRAVESVTDPSGTVLVSGTDVTDVDLEAGILQLRRVSPRHAGRGFVVRASTADGTASLRQAVKIIASHLYETQRGRADGVRAAIFGGTSDGDPTPASGAAGRRGFAIPSRAAQLLEPFEPRVGIA